MNPYFQSYNYNGQGSCQRGQTNSLSMPSAAEAQPKVKELYKMHGLNTYDYGARQHDPILCRWDRIDPLCEKYYGVSPYNYCGNNPVKFIDPDGRKVWLFAATLPGIHVPEATHTFIVITNEKGIVTNYAAYGPEHNIPIGGDKLTQCSYKQDIKVYTDYFKGQKNENLKKAQCVDVPNGMTSEQFDNKVALTIKNFGNKDGITYSITGGGCDPTVGNCNTSSSTVLIKSGVGEKEMEKLENNIPGIDLGFKTTGGKAWTSAEQEKALKVKEEQQRIDNLLRPY